MKQEVHGPYRYCRECDYKSRKANTLSMHVSRIHSKEMNHLCHICPATFPTQTQLGHHIINKHSDATIKCASALCPLVFKNTTTQRTHFVRCHQDKNLLYIRKNDNRCKCISCGNMYSLNAIIYHVSGCSLLSPFNKTNAQHLPEAVHHPVACQLCPESFPTYAQLAHHATTLHPDTKGKCIFPSCEKEFKTTKSANTHYMKSHIGTELLYIKSAEDNSCKCISCENVFTLSTIINHVAKCSYLSPFFSEGIVLCQPAANMVLNQAEEDIFQRGFGDDEEFPDIPDGMFEEEKEEDDEFPDIPDDIVEELNRMY